MLLEIHKYIYCAKIIARNPKIFDVSKTVLEEPANAAIIAPTIITDDIALVTDIKGVCKDGLHSKQHNNQQKLII